MWSVLLNRRGGCGVYIGGCISQKIFKAPSGETTDSDCIQKQEPSSCRDGRPFGHNRHGPKSGEAVSLSVGELSPHLTQCGLGRGLPPHQVVPWSIQPFGHNTLTTQTDRQEIEDRQRSDSTRRTVLQTVAQKLGWCKKHTDLYHSWWVRWCSDCPRQREVKTSMHF